MDRVPPQRRSVRVRPPLRPAVRRPRPTTATAAPTAALAAALLLTGCGGDGAEPGAPTGSAGMEASPGPAGTPQPSAPTSRAPDPTPSDPTPSVPGQRGYFVNSTGVVDEVVDGCVYVLVDDTGDRWSLRGEVPELSVGDRVEVSGATDDTPYDACPDGLPFLVDEVSPTP